MGTTSRGYVYPDSTANARIYEHMQTLADDIDADVVSIDTRLDTIEAGAWAAYTPAWTAASVNPAVGNGSAVGRYRQAGKLVTASLRIVMGSTTTYGTGGYALSLPVAAATTSALFRIGAAYCRDASAAAAGHFSAICAIDTSNPSVLGIFSGNASAGPTVPFTWANGDHLNATITYEAA